MNKIVFMSYALYTFFFNVSCQYKSIDQYFNRDVLKQERNGNDAFVSL